MTLMIMIITLIFPLMNHPMSMGLMLILQTLIISLNMGNITKMFWSSYILVITIISATLILFIYMASIASNEAFNTSSFMMNYTLILIIIISTFMFFMNPLLMENILNISPLLMNYELSLMLTKMFNNQSLTTMTFIITYLLLTMIIISHIINIHEGPLRMKN